MARFHFYQECPVCGRPLQIHVEYLGHPVSCQHCGGRFVAVDPASSSASKAGWPNLLQRAEALLELSHQRLHAHAAARG